MEQPMSVRGPVLAWTREENESWLYAISYKISKYSSRPCIMTIEKDPDGESSGSDNDPRGYKDYVVTVKQKIRVHNGAAADIFLGFCCYHPNDLPFAPSPEHPVADWDSSIRAAGDVKVGDSVRMPRYVRNGRAMSGKVISFGEFYVEDDKDGTVSRFHANSVEKVGSP
jgi:hypothetical protein